MNPTIDTLRKRLSELPTIFDENHPSRWQHWRLIVLDHLHHHLDRRLPYLLTKRKGLRRVEWESGRDERELCRRLSEACSHDKGASIIKQVITCLLDEINMIVEYVTSGVRSWELQLAA